MSPSRMPVRWKTDLHEVGLERVTASKRVLPSDYSMTGKLIQANVIQGSRILAWVSLWSIYRPNICQGSLKKTKLKVLLILPKRPEDTQCT